MTARYECTCCWPPLITGSQIRDARATAASTLNGRRPEPAHYRSHAYMTAQHALTPQKGHPRWADDLLPSFRSRGLDPPPYRGLEGQKGESEANKHSGNSHPHMKGPIQKKGGQFPPELVNKRVGSLVWEWSWWLNFDAKICGMDPPGVGKGWLRPQHRCIKVWMKQKHIFITPLFFSPFPFLNSFFFFVIL